MTEYDSSEHEREGWERTVVDEGSHFIMEKPEHPLAIEVMEYGDDFQASVCVWNSQRGMMGLLSSDYSEEIPVGNTEELRDTVEGWMDEADDGEFDQFKKADA